MFDILFAMIFGVISTCVLHFSKGIEKQNIGFYDQVRAKVEKTENPIKNGKRVSILYFVGVTLNIVPIIFSMLSTSNGTPSSYYSSMFGVGLIVLLIYSAKILKEPISMYGYLGSGILIFGTLILGIQNLFRPDITNAHLNFPSVYAIIIPYVVVGSVAIYFTYKKGGPIVTGIVFGLFSGAIGSLDPFLKAISQINGQNSSFLPTTIIGWAIFIFSFIISFSNWAIVQWGFARKAPASVVVPAFNSMYVAFPIIIYGVALPNYAITPITILGILMIATGMVLMQGTSLFRKKTDK